MLKGLEISETQFSNLSSILRIDAEFFKKPYLLLQEKIKKYKSLDSYLEYLTDGTHVTPKYMNKGIPFLSSGNIGQLLINFEETKFIGEDEHANLKHCQPRGLDLLVSKSGRIGHAAVVPEKYIEGAFNIYEGIALLRLKDVHPYAASVIFNSNLVQLQIKRMQKGVAQPHLHLEDCREILLPRFSEYFELSIRNLAVAVSEYSDMARNRYIEAEHLLLKAIGLEDFSISSEKINIKSFQNSFFATGRLDADYYQLKYEQIEKACFKNAYYIKRIREIQLHNGRGLQPDYVEDGELDVINSRHILDQGLEYKNFEKTSIENWNNQFKARVFRNDILTYTTGANIGRTQVYLSDKKALASNHVNILRIENENPVYVAFFLNSKIGRFQTEQLSAGSAQQELYPKDIADFYIPFVDQVTQTKICALVQESFTLKIESECILETAKQAVEMAIEQDEESAAKWIQEQLNVN